MRRIVKDVVKTTAGIGKSAVKQMAQETVEIPKQAGKEVVRAPFGKTAIQPSPIVEAMQQKKQRGQKQVSREGISRVKRLEQQSEMIRKERRFQSESQVPENRPLSEPGKPILPSSPQPRGEAKTTEIPKKKY